ncbi:hypothetical protein DFH09DRAFT_1371556 [Mycena vulgaris]|nr:hypothetical protein DFH09DRAFT_1371556 [Mycena vulgaris]
MHFMRSIVALTILVVSAVQAAPGVSTSLTQRNWCGFDRTCDCDFDRKTGCVPQFDDCGQQWFWPSQCTGCEPCVHACVDFFVCNPPAA